MTELWAPVKGFESRYEVSNLGRVRSSPCISRDGRRFKGKILSTIVSKKDGYCRINLRSGSARCTKTLHRIVAEVYLPNPENKPEINHKDGNKLNNRVDNLEWATAKENRKHAVDNGLHHTTPVVMMSMSGEPLLVFGSIRQANEYLGRSAGCSGISTCISGRNKTAYGYRWAKQNITRRN